MRLWVTRAEPGAARTAARLAALGHEPLVAPLIALHPLNVPPGGLALDGVAALAFTSAEGVTRFAALSADRARRVYAVGEATAAAARAAGWRDVRSADADGMALAALIAADADRTPGVVLAPGAAARAFDLEAALAPADVSLRPLALYAARPLRSTPPKARAALAAGALDAVLIHSPAAARALGALRPRPPGLEALAVFALSPACATALPPTLRGPRHVAPAPREADLLALPPAPG